MGRETIRKLKSETFDHLINGRYRLSLQSAEKLIAEAPEDTEALTLYAWASLENGDPGRAIQYADIAVDYDDTSLFSRIYRGFILSRTGINDGAISDLEASSMKMEELLSWTYLNKSRSHAGKGDFDKALKEIEKAIILGGKFHPEYENTKKRIFYCQQLQQGKKNVGFKNIQTLVDECLKAVKAKDCWFSLYLADYLLQQKLPESHINDILLIKLESMFTLFMYKPSKELALKIKDRFRKNIKFQNIYETLFPPDEEEKESPNVSKKDLRADAFFFNNPNADVFSAKIYSVNDEISKDKRIYYSNVDVDKISEVGVEVIFNNPFFEDETKTLGGVAIWFMDDKEIGRNEFVVKAKLGWDAVIFTQVFGFDKKGMWKTGQGKVEILIEGVKAARVWFILDNEFKILERDENSENNTNELTPADKTSTDTEKQTNSNLTVHQPEETKSLEELVEEMDSFTGLESVKQAVKDFILYLKFIKERERMGLKSDSKISVNSVFLGNPGTGKTTIARILGNIFKSMGILEKGHVVEVDRAALVGQYVGETAQKTDAVIQEAMGGLLFIDEAYTLIKKGGSGQDFGQEAIDTLLKRMEDKKGEFIVIAAGYPDEMETFLTSNPGMKSRFTHFFNFEDYTPDELITIYKSMISKDEYVINETAENILKKEFINLYRKRDKTFGNARLVRKLVEDTKMQLSKRFIALPEESRTKENITTIIEDDINAILKDEKEKDYDVPIDEEALKEALDELHNLTGLKSVRSEVTDTVKLARYYLEQGENLKDKFSSHILFLGNPGTGKTTVARIFSKIFAALGILSKGHLVETDRQGLVATHVGQTAEKTTEMIEKAKGGTLFIDEAYTLAKGGENDFGKEAIDTLLKRMEDDRGSFIVIAAGYTNEMKRFIESNPGMQSRFSKTFLFEDYTPDEMMIILNNVLGKKELKLAKDLDARLHNYFNEIYRTRDKNFGNARIVRSLVENAEKKHLLKMAELPTEERTEEKINTLVRDDFEELTPKSNDSQKYTIKGDPDKLEKYIYQLNELVGLDSVKEEVTKLVSGLKIAALRKQKGLKVMERNLHSVFMGNPGTGKTTVARIMSLIYKELGLIEKGHLVEVDRSDLVAGFQGQTATKTDKVIQSALGGTLFIDEAYTLSRKGNEYGQEAIDTILKRMEDYRGQFIIIVAGYPVEMNEFLAANPGLESRFTNQFNFEDYSPRQMLEIAGKISSGNGYVLDEGALQLLMETFNYLYENRDNNFGNARTVRNVLYKAISNQESRLATMYEQEETDLEMIILEDVEQVYKELTSGNTNQ